jgi:hypothetical protein
MRFWEVLLVIFLVMLAFMIGKAEGDVEIRSNLTDKELFDIGKAVMTDFNNTFGSNVTVSQMLYFFDTKPNRIEKMIYFDRKRYCV